MLPERRFHVLRSIGGGAWVVYDATTGKHLAAGKTKAEADELVRWLCMAWWDGAEGVKSGEVIL